MIITRPSKGLRSSSWVWYIQVDRPGTRETVPDRFRLIPDDFLMNIQFFENVMFFFCAAASGPQPDPRPTRDPPTTHPRPTRDPPGQLGEHSNDHNSAVRSSPELILCMHYTSRTARNSWDRSRGRSSSVDRRKWRIFEKSELFHKIGLHEPDFD